MKLLFLGTLLLISLAVSFPMLEIVNSFRELQGGDCAHRIPFQYPCFVKPIDEWKRGPKNKKTCSEYSPKTGGPLVLPVPAHDGPKNSTSTKTGAYPKEHLSKDASVDERPWQRVLGAHCGEGRSYYPASAGPKQARSGGGSSAATSITLGRNRQEYEITIRKTFGTISSWLCEAFGYRGRFGQKEI